MIPFLELKPTYLELKDEMDLAYHRVMNSGWYLMGEETEAFEAEFASYVGTKHCVTVGNGLDALRIALAAHGVGPGDEVIVPAHTFIATWLAVSQCGAIPIGVDVRLDTANLDASLLDAALTSRTKAIIPVHLYGQPADMDPIRDFATRHGLIVIEDAAQAHGARYKGNMCGTLGHAAAFSFYPGKNLGAFSDGGAIATNDDSVARTARMLRNYGSEKRYHHDIAGMNSRIDELQAAFLRVKLQHLDEWNGRRRQFAELYISWLASSVPHISLPSVMESVVPVWHLFVIRNDSRDALQSYLTEGGVQTVIHYPIPPNRSKAYASQSAGRFPIAETLAGQILSLPIGPHFTVEQITRCAEQVAAFVSL
jgi:dTDP-4-amino-4,6-dideoxygalactose transaminase